MGDGRKDWEQSKRDHIDNGRRDSQPYKDLCERNEEYVELMRRIDKMNDLTVEELRFVLALPKPETPTPLWDYRIDERTLIKLKAIV